MTTSPLVLCGPQRLVLRQFIPRDARPLFALIDCNRAHLSQRGDPTASKYRTYEDVLSSITHPANPHRLRLGIWRGSALVGTVNLTPDIKRKKVSEIGYWVGRQYAGRCCAMRALGVLEQWVRRQTNIKQLIATVHIKNIPSQKTLGRSGFCIEYQNGTTYYCEKKVVRAAP